MDEIKIAGNRILVNGVDRTPHIDRNGRDIRPVKLDRNKGLWVFAERYSQAADFGVVHKVYRTKVRFVDQQYHLMGMRQADGSKLTLYCIGLFYRRKDCEIVLQTALANGFELVEVKDWRPEKWP